METNNKYVPKNTLEIEETLICDIYYKPTFSLILGALFGVLMFFTGNILAIVLGVFVLAFVLFVYLKVQDYITLSIYPSFVLVYQLGNSEMVRKIYYEDVEEWTCKDSEGKSNAVMIKLKTQEVIYKDTFQTSKAYGKFDKIMHEKETRAIQQEKNRQRELKFKFKWPFKKKK